MLEDFSVPLRREWQAYSQDVLGIFGVMRRIFTQLSVQRIKLRERRVIVEVHKYTRGADAANPFDAELAGMGRVQNLHIDERWYLHIGNPVFSPWGATFKRLKYSETQSPQEDGEVQLVDIIKK